MTALLHIPPQRVVLAVTLAALVATAILAFVFDGLHRPMAPYTIVDLEFAGAPARLVEMTEAWGASGIAAARQSLWLDFLFMPAYTLLFAGLALMVARATSGLAQTLGLWLTLMPFAAWAWDLVENVVLLSALPPALAAETALRVAAVAAGVKFGVLGLSGLYIVAGGVWWLMRGRVRRIVNA